MIVPGQTRVPSQVQRLTHKGVCPYVSEAERRKGSCLWSELQHPHLTSTLNIIVGQLPRAEAPCETRDQKGLVHSWAVQARP